MKVKELHIRFFFISLLTLFAMGFSSCSGEDNAEDIMPDDDNSEERLYFSMRVKTADLEDLNPDVADYIDGSDIEHAVDFSGKSENVIIFFDADYQYKGYSLLEFDRLSAQGSTVGTTDAEEIAFIGFLRADYHEAYIMEKYGLLVLNAYDITTALKQLDELGTFVTVKDVLELVDTSTNTHIAGRSGNYFTMTSAAYLAKKSDGWRHSILVEIDRDKVFSTRDQAIIQPAVVAYVERMASKFSFKVSGADDETQLNFLPSEGRAQVIVCNYVNGQPYYNNRNWTCTLTGWGISKYEPTVYYFRNIVGETTDDTSYPYSYGTDINLTGQPFFNGWNRASDHRCFWAVDPHYKNGIYPTQYRPAVDNPSINYYGKEGKPSLAYISYNDLSTDFSGLKTNEDGAILYSTENTFPDTRHNSLWQHDLAGSELVIGAQIHINTVNENRADYDLFRNRLGIFFPSKTDFATYFITTINNQLSSQSTMTYRYYDWKNPANNGETVMRSLKIDNSNYKLYYNDQPLTPETMAALSKFTIPATIEDGDGKVIPWIEGMYIGRRAIDPNTYEEYGEIIKLSVKSNEFKSLIYDWVGAFDHFNGGRMTYSVPVRYKASEDKVSASTYRPTIGDYGVVRNTWYRFDLMEIHNLGTPVDDLNQKIIPYKTTLENSIMMEIKAIDWHEFSTTVTLPGAQNK